MQQATPQPELVLHALGDLSVEAISEPKTYSLHSLKQTTQIGISLFKQKS